MGSDPPSFTSKLGDFEKTSVPREKDSVFAFCIPSHTGRTVQTHTQTHRHTHSAPLPLWETFLYKNTISPDLEKAEEG